MKVNWVIERLEKNHYRLTKEDLFIEFTVDGFSCDDEILISTVQMPHMSTDNVIFLNELFPTPDDDPHPVIGKAYKYDPTRTKCIDKTFVLANIIDTNMNIFAAKHQLEMITY